MSRKVKAWGVRGEILKALRENPEWREKLEKARSVEEFREVVKAFAKSRGYEVVTREEDVII